MKGRKRHIVVDTLGLIIAILIHEASIQDRDGGPLVIAKAKERDARLRKIWADAGYAGRCVDVVREATGIDLEIVRRPGAGQGTLCADGEEAPQRGFKILPHRWIVERTFGWIGRYRRLSKDYEQTIDSSTAWVLLAMVRLLTRRLGAAREAQGI